MKYTLTLLATLVATLTFAQGKWSPYASIEENIHISDIRPSFNYTNLSTPAGNLGIRIGTFFEWNSNISAETTLGIIGVSTPGNFSNKIIPIEIIGHYSLAQNNQIALISKINLDFGAGAGLAESGNGNFGFAEHLVLGASLELPDLVPFGTLIMGTRYTAFIDDYIDGTVVSGSNNDGVLRFYTAVRLDGENKKAKQALEDAAALAAKVGASLEKSESEKAAIEKELKAAKKAHALEKAALMDELEALKAAPVEEAAASEEPTVETKGYCVIIGSFPTNEMASKFVNSTGENYIVSFMKYLNTYRVVYSMHENLADARTALEAAKAVVETAWIAVY